MKLKTPILLCLLFAPALGAAAGNDDAQIKEACAELAVQKVMKQPADECVRLAGSGDAHMQTLVGVHFLGKRDFQSARRWFGRAAEQGDATAQNGMGFLYQFGHGVKKDRKIANQYFLKSAKQGNADSQYWLGENLILAGNYQEGAYWTAQGARQGSADAQFNLAVLYRDGHGVKKDEGYMYFWLTVSAQNGNQKSQALMDKLNPMLDQATRDELDAFVQKQLEDCPACLNEPQAD
jgi:hypothetical protein